MSKIKKFKIKNYKKKIKPIIQMVNISKSYGPLNVLRDLNMNIMPSSITGLLGPNGSGKTTLFNILLGITKMDAGKLFINRDGKKNVDIGSLPIHQRCSENQIKFIPQYDSLFRNLNVEDNLRAVAEIFLKDRREIEEKVENLLSEFSLIEQRKTLAHSLSGGQKKKVAICRALIGDCRIMVLDEPCSNIDPITIEMIKDRREIEEKVENLLSEFSLIEQRKTLAHSLSGGQKKKVAICRALIGECRIMVLDEPLSNIDPITIEMIKDVIVKLQLTRSITILISDHAFENVLQIADEIKILSDGYICSEGSPSSVVKDERAREKYFGVNY